MSVAVEINNGYKYFGKSDKDPNKKIVLNYINVTVEHNSIYGLLGASGCGKTTLLSCIVGRSRLNNGNIRVLGGEPGSPESAVPGTKLGYMPQGTGLMTELTVKEILYYFGRLQGMEDEEISERYKFLTDLLELPNGDRYINSYSGGQQRRISFAVAVLQDPELLILDEPTVGLDSLLREKIWNYLLDEVRTRKLAVIITTHYIDEAKQATKIGMMRHGVLLAEDSPSNILSMYRTEKLEDAFLEMCLEQQTNLKDSESEQKRITNPTESMNQEIEWNKSNLESEEKKLEKQRGNKLLTKRRMKAMLVRNYLQIIRQPSILILLLTSSIVQGIFYHITIGHVPEEIRYGVVNQEIPSYNFCEDKNLVTVISNDTNCNMYKISCRFLNVLKSDTNELVYYNTYNEAQTAMHNSLINGIIQFSSNFTEAFKESLALMAEVDDGTLDAQKIHILLDNSHHMLHLLLKIKIFETYETFVENLSLDCQYPTKLALDPLNFMEPIYGSKTPSYTRYMFPGFAVIMIFFLNSAFTSMYFLDSKLCGFYDRIMVAGVNPIEILVSLIIVNSVLICIQCISFIFVVIYYFQYTFKGNILHFFILMILQAYGGLSYGLLIGIACNTIFTAGFAITGTFMPLMLLSGVIWPVEGMPYVLKYIAHLLPFTSSAIAIRDLLEKGYGYTHYTILRGYASSVFSVIILLLFCIILLNIKK